MKKLFYLFTILFAALFTACENDEPGIPSKVETGAAENITATSAMLKGMVNVDIIDYEELVFGVMYSTKAEDLVDFTAPSKNGLILIGNEFKVNVTELKAETKYYYRAYVMLNTLQILLGDVKEFTTLEKSGSDEPEIPETPEEPEEPETPEVPETPEDPANGHAYVDLGLSVKWATMNVGATSPEEYGDYFAWGETQPKEEYNWSTYKWCEGSYDTQTKYCTDSKYGTVDNKTILELSDDAANANWGGSWRMPTEAEQDELRTECTWTWTTQNGVKGYKVTSKTNGNSIFLPAAGYRYDSDLYRAGSNGHYWGGSLYTSRSYYAYYLGFGSSSVSWYYNERGYGQSVRPVYDN